MPGFYDSIDMRWDDNGDYLLSEDGDFQDTSSDTIESFVAEIKSVLRSELGDWEKHPNYAADLREFIGEPNNPETAKRIENRIIYSLVQNNVVSRSDVSARLVPTRPDTGLVILTIQAMPTETNSLGESGTVSVVFAFNLIEGGILFLDSERKINLFPVTER